MFDWTGHDYLAARLDRGSEGYLLNTQQRGELRRYLLRTLPPAALNPGAAGQVEAIRAAIAGALRDRVLAGVALSPDPATVARLYAETVGLGPLDALLDDETVTSVTANGPGQLMVERLDRGGVVLAPGFDSAESLLCAMDALAGRAGRALSPADPVVDLVWDDPDGQSTRVHLNLLARKAPFLALRRGRRDPIHLDAYVAHGRLDRAVAGFLAKAVQAGVAIVVTGMPGSGKTTLLEALLHLTTPHHGHVVLIEDDPEINVRGLAHVSAFQVPRPLPGDEAPVGFLGLVLASLRMNCRSILVCGEVRGAEAGAIVAVMPSYRAVWMTVHGTTPEDGLERLVAAAQMGGGRPPSPFSGGRQEHLVRRNLAAGLQLIVQMNRLADDRLVVAGVYWLEGLSDDGRGWDLTPIFLARQEIQDGVPAVTWQANPSFSWPEDVAARLAMAEIAAEALDEETFETEMASARAALDGNQPSDAVRRLTALFGLAPAGDRRQSVLRLLRQALIAQPERWPALLEEARATQARLMDLAGRRDWEQAGQVLVAVDREPEQAVALEQVGVDELRDQIAAGLEGMAALQRTEERARRLAAVNQPWEALSLLAAVPLDKMPSPAAARVTESMAGQLRILQAQAEAGDEDPDRVGIAIRRLLPRSFEALHAWADTCAGAEVPPGDDDRQVLYLEACRAMSAGDRNRARTLLQKLGDYRSAQRLLHTLGE